MSERDGYQPGVPCWIDSWVADADRAVAFYTGAFGWDTEETVAGDGPTRYVMCRLRGRDVAAIGAGPPATPPPLPAWTTYVWVESAADTTAKVSAAGGTVLAEPSDSLDGGRLAIAADPTGAVFGFWEPGGHRGAQLVNEPGAWSMSQLNTSDRDAAKEFYEAVFGWSTETFAFGDAEVDLFRLPGYVGGEPGQPVSREVVAVIAPTDSDAPSHWKVDFWVADADAIADRAGELGGEVVVAPYDVPGFRQALLADPDGAVFSVSRLVLGP